MKIQKTYSNEDKNFMVTSSRRDAHCTSRGKNEMISIITTTIILLLLFSFLPRDAQCASRREEVTMKFLSVLDPEGGSPNATLVVLVLLVVGISSLKIHKAFLICSGAQRNFAYTFMLTFPTDLPSQILKLFPN